MPVLKLLKRFRRSAVRGEVWHGDALDFLRSMREDSAEIVFLDPPFNLGKRYDPLRPKVDSLPEAKYESWLRAVVEEAIRVLSQGGALYLYHLPIWALRLGGTLQGSLCFHHWIAVSMKNGFARGSRLYPAHYALLLFTKGKPTRLRRPKLQPQVCRHCGEYIKDYGGYRSIIEQKGINLSDFWEDLSPVRHSNRKFRVANELPNRLFERVIEISGAPGQLYVDPFAGSGSGLIAAARAGMAFKGCDLVFDNCSIMLKRLEQKQTDRSWA